MVGDGAYRANVKLTWRSNEANSTYKYRNENPGLRRSPRHHVQSDGGVTQVAMQIQRWKCGWWQYEEVRR
jgi:hypothetical protein